METDEVRQPEPAAEPRKVKKQYRVPELQVHGTVDELTHSNAFPGASDLGVFSGGGPPP